MNIREAQDLKAEADARGLRRALVVTALGLEMDAVRAYLTESCSVIGSDGSVYECGVFSDSGQDWLVVVVETGAGTHPAQSAVQHAHFAMGEFEVQLLIGIGGSRKEDDAPIGSVVASERVYMPYAGKDTDRGRMSRPREFPLDGRLVGLARLMRRYPAWMNRIRPPFGGAFPEVYPVDMPPIAHVAPIASVEVVVAGRKSATEAMLAKDYNDTCVVEMEGYGAVYAATSVQTPSIIIRGISDLAMKKTAATDKSRQPVAACHAAAFGFELLAQWGENYLPPARIVARPGRQTPPGPQAPSAAEPPPEAPVLTSPALPPAATSRRVVLNLDLDPATATPEKIAEWQEMLRTLTGSDSLQVVAAEEGSVRLVVEDPSGTLGELDLEKLRERLESDEGIGLLGRVEEAEYRQLTAVEEQLRLASGDLMSWPTTLPDGEWIDRPELSSLIDIVRNGTRSTTALLGLPGAGKSALLATLSQQVVQEMKWPLLAIKADQLPQEVATEDHLAEYLGLPARPSELIGRLSKLRPVVLVIDQLDALAGHLDLRVGRLNVLMNLIRRLGEVDNVHIVLSSRTFEFEHDVRLKSIRAQDIRLELPAWPKVAEILKANGVEADGWPEDAQEVMRSPQALTTYLSLDRTKEVEVFSTYQAMLERLWGERITAGDRGSIRSQLVSELAEDMAARETLWLPRIRFEDREDDIKALESAGILTALGGAGSLGFTHQTLFDHALARSFARGLGSLSAYVLERQTSLFLRPKLWAALTYLRGVDLPAYDAELESIWTAQGLRTHLQLLLIDFIGQQIAPTDREVLIMDRALTGPDARPIALKAIAGSSGWFDRLASSRIAEAMTTEPDLAQMILMGAWSHAPDAVIRLIGERWIGDVANDGRTWMVLQNAPAWSPAALELAQTVLTRTSITHHHLDFVVGTLGVDQPTVALALVKSRLDRDLSAAKAEAAVRNAETLPAFEKDDERIAWRINHSPREPIRRLFEQSQDWDSLPALAEKWPCEFLEILWPWFLSVIDALQDLSADREGLLGFDLGYDGDFRFEDEKGLNLPEPAILAAVRTAAESLAISDPDAFLKWANAQSGVDAALVHRLIAHVMSLSPDVWSKAALEFLLADIRRWYMGSHHDHLGTTARLIEQSAEHWDAEELGRFEAALLAYAPPPPKSYDNALQRRGWRRAIRRMKLRLLRSLPKARASAATRKTIQEEGRALGDETHGVTFSGPSLIGSRMDANAMAKATDADILNAFRALPDATEWHHPRDWMSGGNIQLAREFATFAKSEPYRALRLVEQFTPEIGTRAAGYAIDALGETGDAAEIQKSLKSLVERGFMGEEFRTSTSSGIERLARRKAAIADETIAILETWLRNPASPPPPEDDDDAEEIDTAGELQTKGDDAPPTRSMLWGYGGISILPGGDYPILSALIHIRLARKESDALIDILNEVLTRSADQRMWENLLHLVAYFPAGKPDRRPDLISRIFERAPSLMATKSGAHLLAYAHWWSDEMARAQLVRPAWQATASARQTYGELVGLIAIVRPQLDWPAAMLAEVLSDSGSVEARAGAALSAANTWSDPKNRRLATDVLAEVIPHREQGVWAAVFDLFRLIDDLTPDVDTVRLLKAMAEHVNSAPPVSATFVVERLQSLLPHEARLVARIALGLVEIWKEGLGDMRTAHALAAPELVDLAVTLHRLGPETREVGTELFEKLIKLDAYSARATMDQIDSRFRSVRGTARPRLQRRRSPQRRRRAS